nr:MAG TPA: hypothetical protein [Caudoviricetes sp.]
MYHITHYCCKTAKGNYTYCVIPSTLEALLFSIITPPPVASSRVIQPP